MSFSIYFVKKICWTIHEKKHKLLSSQRPKALVPLIICDETCMANDSATSAFYIEKVESSVFIRGSLKISDFP